MGQPRDGYDCLRLVRLARLVDEDVGEVPPCHAVGHQVPRGHHRRHHDPEEMAEEGYTMFSWIEGLSGYDDNFSNIQS